MTIEAKIIGHEDYIVSSEGYIYSLKNNHKKQLKGSNAGRGYRAVTLCKNGKLTYKYIHRLVAECFIPNPKKLKQINHKDGNKLNNSIDNLEWCNNSHNNKEAYKLGLKIPTKGTISGMSKLTDSLVSEIRNLYSTGNYSHRDLAKKFNIHFTTIGSIVRKDHWNHL